MVKTRKYERAHALIGRLSAEFLSRLAESNPLITITSVSLSPDRKYATIFFTTFPEGLEEEALALLQRNASAMHTYLEEHARMGHVPFLKFEVDYGERNRQKIDTLSVVTPEKHEVTRAKRKIANRK